MSAPPPGPQPAPARSPRVVIVSAGRSAPDLARVLAAAGFIVETREIPDRSNEGAPTAGADPIVVEIPAGGSAPPGAAIVEMVARESVEIERLRRAVRHARDTAHDLAQPLTTVLARAQLLAGSVQPDSPHYRAVSIICKEAGRLAEIAENFNKLKEMAPLPDSSPGPGDRDPSG